MSNFANRVKRSLGVLLITAGLPVLVAAQLNKVVCAKPSQKGALVLSVEAKQSSPLATPPGLHLVIDQLPAEDGIEVSDAALKAAIKVWVAKQNSLSQTDRHDWILDGNKNTNGANLFRSGLPESLGMALGSAFTINFTPLAQPKVTSPAQQQTVNFCFASTAPPVTVKALEVFVSTVGYKALPKGDPGRLSIVLAAPGNGVTAQALIAGNEFSNDVEKNQLLNALTEVAKTVWGVAQSRGLHIGGAAPDSLQRDVESQVVALYSMQSGTLGSFFSDWPNLMARVQYFPQTDNFVLEVIGVTMAKSANIQVDLGITPGTGKGTAKAIKLALQTENDLNQRFSARLDALTNSVPTFDQIDSLSTEIALAPEIVPSLTPVSVETSKPQVIVFNTKNRWISFGFKLSAGVKYSAEEKAAGTATFEGDNLVLKLPDNLPDLPKESESLSYTGGNEVQKLNAAWAIDWTHDHQSQAQSTYGVHFSGDYLQDSDQRFGNLQGPPLRDRERGAKGSVVYSFSSRPQDDQGNPLNVNYGLNATVGLEYRRVNVDPVSGIVLPPLGTGTMTDAFGNLTLNYRYEPVRPKSGGLGGLELTLVSQAIRGFSSGDFPFTQVSLSGQGTLYFGYKHPRDFFVRYRQGLGTSHGRTPLFELFRLGGPDILRGIEQGEFVGRRIGYQQSEAGLSIRQIISWFASKSQTRPAPDAVPATPPLDLSKIYLKGFYDRGRVTNNAGFSDLLAFRHAAKGYGFAVEIQALQAKGRSVTLSIGYARSPDSVLHRSGLPITSASINF